MNHNTSYFVVKYKDHLGRPQEAIFLDIERAKLYLVKYHDAVLKGLREVDIEIDDHNE